MKIISTGSDFRIYTDDLKTYDQLPAQAYTVSFSMNSGFFLEKYADIEINEKIYGVHEKKVQKVMNGFERSQRNFGVILSGAKGIGKSLFSKMLIKNCIDQGYPVLIVESYIGGISSFINSIEQPVVVLFDEFDKTFCGKGEDRDSCRDPQTEMLSLFDGISQGKKLFVITCNSLHKLNDYLVNRPGRFHYHFRFDYPDREAIIEYLSDRNIPKEEIEKVISFSCKVQLNYDCLRAIAFELETGDKFEEAIGDLNILNIKEEKYSITVFFKDGSHISRPAALDLFDSNFEDTLIYYDIPKTGDELGFIRLNPANIKYDTTRGAYVLEGNDVHWTLEHSMDKTFDKDYSDKENEIRKEWREKELDYVAIRHHVDKNLHYAV